MWAVLTLFVLNSAQDNELDRLYPPKRLSLSPERKAAAHSFSAFICFMFVSLMILGDDWRDPGSTGIHWAYPALFAIIGGVFVLLAALALIRKPKGKEASAS